MNRPIAYLGDHVSLTTTVYGSRIYVDTEDTVVSPHILLEGNWESWISAWVRAQLRHGMTFVDVGANCGWFTLLAAHLVKETGRVVAFECNPKLAKLLRQSASINGYKHVEVVEKAAWREEAELAFTIPSTGSGNGSVAVDVTEPSYAVRTVVGACRVDSVVEHADLVKIDVEGAEPMVIEGLRGLVERNPGVVLLVESHPSTAAVLGDLRDEWDFGVVERSGFAVPIAARDLHHLPDSEMVRMTRKK